MIETHETLQDNVEENIPIEIEIEFTGIKIESDLL